jgi:hypothetical protein
MRMTNNTAEKAEDMAKRERSTAYPSIALEQALVYSAKLVESYRKSPFSRQNAVEGIGYTKITGDTAQKIAALVHYGLLERSGTSAYKNTQLAQDIYYFTSEEEKASDIVIAAQSPKLFRTLLTDLKGQSLPARLKNILIQPHGITPAVADKVAENFKKTLEFAGLLPNGVVATVSVSAEGESEETPALHRNAPSPARVSVGGMSPSVSGTRPQIPSGVQSLPLPSGIIILYPVELAYHFAIGKFATQVSALDTAVSEATEKKHDDPGNDTASAGE